MAQQRRTFTVILEREENGGYSAYCPSLPRCVSQRDDRPEALENVMEAAGMVLEILEDRATGLVWARSANIPCLLGAPGLDSRGDEADPGKPG